MLTVKETSSLVKLTPTRIKQLLKENEGWNIQRSRGQSGFIKIPHETIRNFLDHKNLSYVSRVITIAVEKGGVGKTFLSTNVAVECSRRGAKVLLIDLDPEACSTNTLLPEDMDYQKIKTVLEVFTHDLSFKSTAIPSRYQGLDIVPCKGLARRVEKHVISENPKYLIANKLEGLRDSYDLIMFDLPPSFSTLVSSAYLACDEVIMPCMPTIYCEESVDLTISDIKDEAKKYDAKIPKIKILLNSFRNSEKASRDTRHNVEIDFRDLLLPFEIGKTADVQNNINEGVTVFEGKAGKDIRNDIRLLAEHICPLVKIDSPSNQ